MLNTLVIFDLDDTLFSRLPDGHSEEQLNQIKLYPHLNKFLNRRDIKKALVTKGDEDVQRKKIASLGIKNHFDDVLICSEDIEKNGADSLSKMSAVLVPGGFGIRGIEGKIKAVQFARENKIPFLGICLGLQVAIIEFARNMVNMKGANSTEFDENTQYPVIGLITEWEDENGNTQKRDKESNLGGTMRLGGQECELVIGSRSHKIYGADKVIERHRHRYEVNNKLISKIEAAGLIVSGRSNDGSLVEMIEISDHPWFVACQFHPEFTSTPRDGHPLFESFIEAAKKAHNLILS